jgi:large subunit ribosomal protein L9
MKVVLKQSVPKVGKVGEVVTVKDGFARNFLFPRRMAVVADKSQLQVLARRNAKADSLLAETQADAEKIREKIHGKVLRIESKVGKETGKLFGAVTSQDIADAIAKELGVTLEKKAVLLNHPIKRLGTHTIEIDVHRKVAIQVQVQVFDPEVEAAEAEAAKLAASREGKAPAPKAEEAATAEAAADPEAEPPSEPGDEPVPVEA